MSSQRCLQCSQRRKMPRMPDPALKMSLTRAQLGRSGQNSRTIDCTGGKCGSNVLGSRRSGDLHAAHVDA